MPLRTLYITILFLVVTCSKENPLDISMEEKYHADIEEIREEIQLSRQLKFKRNVKVGSITREQYGNNNSFYPYANELMVTFKQLGYLSDTVKDYEKILIDFYTGFPAAYYTNGSDSITLVTSDISSERFRGLVAHEFTHALQDQNFNIGSGTFIPDQSTSQFNSDFYTTRRCIVEGDAEIQKLKFQYNIQAASEISDAFSKNMQKYLAQLASFDLPQYLYIRSYSPYYIGAFRVAKVYESGGNKCIDSLFHANRFLSSAEVITGQKIDPVIFDVSDIIGDWRKKSLSIQFADDDNYGAVMLMALLCKYVDQQHCMDAFGWRGDRLIYMRSNDEPWGRLVWSMAFDSKNNAVYIMNKIDLLLQNRVLDGNISRRTVVNTDSLVTFTTGTVRSTLLRSENSLFWFENIDNPQTVAANIMNSTLAKKQAIQQHFEMSPDLIRTKKAIIDLIRENTEIKITDCDY